MTQIIIPGMERPMSLRDFYISLTGLGEGYVWLIQPSAMGEAVWLLTCEHKGMQVTHQISEDQFTAKNAKELRAATVKAFSRGLPPSKKFNKQPEIS